MEPTRVITYHRTDQKTIHGTRALCPKCGSPCVISQAKYDLSLICNDCRTINVYDLAVTEDLATPIDKLVEVKANVIG